MNYVDVDGDPRHVRLLEREPRASRPGATVLFAGLYWGAALDPGETLPLQCIPGGARTGARRRQSGRRGLGLAAAPGRRRLRPGQRERRSTPTPRRCRCGNAGAIDERTRYQAFADVTSLVQAGGGGTYTVAQRPGRHGRRPPRRLVARRRLPGRLRSPPRNLTIFDGFAQVALNTTVPITVTGFKTPLTGAVNTQIGIVAYEGDRDADRRRREAQRHAARRRLRTRRATSSTRASRTSGRR